MVMPLIHFQILLLSYSPVHESRATIYSQFLRMELMSNTDISSELPGYLFAVKFCLYEAAPIAFSTPYNPVIPRRICLV